MALDYEDAYPGQVLDGGGEYPEGRARDVSVPGAGDGTPFTADVLNDIWGFHQALTRAAHITVSGDVDTAEASDRARALQIITRRVACRCDVSGTIGDGERAILTLADLTGEAPFETDYPIFATVNDAAAPADPGTQLRIPEELEPFGMLYRVAFSGLVVLSAVVDPSYGQFALRTDFDDHLFSAVRFSTNPLHPVPVHFETLASIQANGDGLVSIRNDSGFAVTFAGELCIARVTGAGLNW